MLNEKVEKIILATLQGYKERFDVEISEIGFDQNHLHILCRFLPKYSGGQVVRLIKSMTARRIFSGAPEVKRELWGGDFWTDGYYISTVSGRGSKDVIVKYIRNQGREKEIDQLRMFEV